MKLVIGEKLTGSDRVLTIASAGLPFVTGPMLKSAKNGGKIAVEKAPDVVKGAKKFIKKNAPKVKKAVNKTDVAEDTAKVMKKKAIKKAKDAHTKVRKIDNPIMENMQRRVPNSEIDVPIKRGNAPYSKKDGLPIEIHHNEQEP